MYNMVWTSTVRSNEGYGAIGRRLGVKDGELTKALQQYEAIRPGTWEHRNLEASADALRASLGCLTELQALLANACPSGLRPQLHLLVETAGNCHSSSTSNFLSFVRSLCNREDATIFSAANKRDLSDRVGAVANHSKELRKLASEVPKGLPAARHLWHCIADNLETAAREMNGIWPANN